MYKKPTIDPSLLERHSYQVSHLIASFTVPLMRELYQEFDGDMVQLIVLGEIATRNVSQFFRDNPGGMHEKILDDESQRLKLIRPCNVLSISEVTGIPRETVRRKVDQLIASGWLYRDERKRLMLRPGVGERHAASTTKRVKDILELAAQLQALLQPSDADRD